MRITQQTKENAMEEEQKTKKDAERENRRVLVKKDEFEQFEIRVSLRRKNELGTNCCMCPFAHGVNTASRARRLMILILGGLPGRL